LAEVGQVKDTYRCNLRKNVLCSWSRTLKTTGTGTWLSPCRKITNYALPFKTWHETDRWTGRHSGHQCIVPHPMGRGSNNFHQKNCKV